MESHIIVHNTRAGFIHLDRSVAMTSIVTLVKPHPQDVSFLTTSMQQLKAVQGKFRDSKRALAAIVPENEGVWVWHRLTEACLHC